MKFTKFLKKEFIYFGIIAAINLEKALAATINPKLPGNAPAGSSQTGIANTVTNFYGFALMASYILAFGMIVYSGIKYVISSGNPSKQSDAKDGIVQALLGLLLLLAAGLILRTLNPQILNFGPLSNK